MQVPLSWRIVVRRQIVQFHLQRHFMKDINDTGTPISASDDRPVLRTHKSCWT